MSSLQELAAIKSLLPQSQPLGIGQLAQMAFQQKQDARQNQNSDLHRQQILASIANNRENTAIRSSIADREFSQKQQAFDNLIAQQARENAFRTKALGFDADRSKLAREQFDLLKTQKPLQNDHLVAQIAMTQAAAAKQQLLNNMVAASLQGTDQVGDSQKQRLLEHFMGVAQTPQK